MWMQQPYAFESLHLFQICRMKKDELVSNMMNEYLLSNAQQYDPSWLKPEWEVNKP
jgi:hypothetical protein